MKKTLTTLAAITLMALATTGARGEAYIGGSIGSSAMVPTVAEDSINQWNAVLHPTRAKCESVGCYSDEESSGGLKIFGGYRVNPYFAVEGFIAHLGSFDSYAYDGQSVDVFASAEVGTLGVAAVGLLPLGSGRVSLLGKLGFHSWSAEGDIDLLDTEIPAAYIGSYEESGVDGMGGVGVQIDFGDRAAMRVEFEYFAAETDYTDFGIGLFSVGGMFRF